MENNEIIPKNYVDEHELVNKNKNFLIPLSQEVEHLEKKDKLEMSIVDLYEQVEQLEREKQSLEEKIARIKQKITLLEKDTAQAA